MTTLLNRRRIVSVMVLAFAAAPAVLPGQAQSLPDTLEAIQRARVATRILYITAHPDDEAGALLTYLSRGLGAEVALLTLTRGEGGQNAIGPEMGGQLAVIRSSELLAATRLYGVQLFFTRAPDFGYSKTMEETLRIWGDSALADMVRVMRTFRPDIVINGWDTVRSGHGNHQASGFLTPKAFEMSADPKAFPEQLSEGLKPWRAAMLLQPGRADDANSWQVPVDEISPIWGKSYREISIEALANHRSQGLPGFLSSPFLRRAHVLVRSDGGKLDPAVLGQPLAQLFPDHSYQREAAQAADRSLATAQEAAEKLDWRGTTKALAAAGREIDRAIKMSDPSADSRGERWLYDLRREKERIDLALAAAAALQVDARADRGEIVSGENFTVRVNTRSRNGVLNEVGKPSLVLPAGWSVTKEEADPVGGTRFTVSIPKDAKVPHSPTGWMLPLPPPLVEARVHNVMEGYSFDASAPVQAQRLTSTRVDTLPLVLMPAVTLALEPRQFLIVEKHPPKQLELLVRVHSYGSSAAEVTLGLDAPKTWQVSAPGPLAFSGPGDQLARFRITLPGKITAGKHELKIYARRDGDTFRTTVEPLASLPTRLWSEPAVALVLVFDIVVPEGLRVGYIAAENDPMPEVLRRLGLHVELLDPVALAFGSLSRFDAIAIGIRAYELREDLIRANQRLLDYTTAGGTLVVQYQRENIWSRLKPAPFPASVGNPTVRITDENSPVRFLVPDHPVLNIPNKISQEDFKGWVQERGLYFWSQWDPRYQSLLALRDPGEEEATGGLVYARYGKGVYIYTGLAFFRQLPEGVSGAYRLFINLLSQSKARP